MAKLFRFLRTKKALGKENFLDDDHVDRQNRRVNFRESFGNSGHSSSNNRNAWKSQCYNDEDDDSSEITLKAPPLNPYHVITDPKKRRAPRSCPGGPNDLEDFGGRGRSRARGSGAATIIGEHDLSFQSVDDREHRGGKQSRKLRYLDSLHNGQLQPFRELGNGRSMRDSSGRNVNPKSNRNHYKNMEQENDNDDDEWTNKRIPKYEEKIQDLTESLYQSINNERQAKKERKFWHQKYNDTMSKNMKMQSDIEALRTLIYGLENELHNLRTSLTQREDYHSSSSTAFRHPLHHGLSHMHHHPTTITPLLTNTATTSSTGVPGSAAISSTPRHQQLSGCDASHKLADGGGSGESLALLSSSSLCPAGNCNAHLSHHRPKSGMPNVRCSAGSRKMNTVPHHQQQLAPSSSSAFDSPRIHQFYDKTEENFGDEVKNFRSMHAESFSGSSRQGTEDEELERIKSELKKQMSCSAMSSRTSKGQHSDTSSPAHECPRGNNTVIDVSQVSANCLGISLYNDSSIIRDASGSCRNFSSSHEILAVRDDGYSTSETVSTILLPLNIAAQETKEENGKKNVAKSPSSDNHYRRESRIIGKEAISSKELKKSASFS